LTSHSAPELHIPSHMNLEQAMSEVRRYLEVRNRFGTMPPEPTGRAASSSPAQLSLQTNCIGHLREIASRLGQVDVNSKLGAPGGFLKRIVAKLIGWYSRPGQEFDRASIEAFQQVRQDMLTMKQQIAAIEQLLAAAPAMGPPASVASSYSQLLCAMVELSKTLVALRTLRQELQQQHSNLPPQFESLLDAVEDDLRRQQAVLVAQLAPKPAP